MSQSARDTQFTGFAALLLEELLSKRDGMLDVSDWWKEQARLAIAQRAYDLVLHVLNNEKEQYTPLEDIGIGNIPDLTQWSEDGESMLPAGEWEELASVQRNDIYEMKDRMVRHLNAEVEAFYKWHPELKIDYRFQVEAVRR